MTFTVSVLAASLGLFSTAASSVPGVAGTGGTFRPPATPLVACDPYFSVWSMADRLTDDWSKHWTGRVQAMCGMVRIDGKPFRFMGVLPKEVPAMTQVASNVYPTRSVYKFEAGGVGLNLTFMTPVLPDDLDLLSRPASYVVFEAKSMDGAKHAVSVYLDVTGEWVVNEPGQEVEWKSVGLSGNPPLAVLKMGSVEQPILAKQGDDLRIDWGYLNLVYAQSKGNSGTIGSAEKCRASFADDGTLPKEIDTKMPRKVNDELPAMAVSMDLGGIGAEPAERFLTLVYDDIYSIEYMKTRLRGYWQRNGMDIAKLIEAAVKDYRALAKKCAAFDAEFVADARQVGGEKYADIVTIAFRQVVAAHKLVADADGAPMLFSKENFSNGCIATVDVSYPSSPFFLLFSNKLMEALLDPIMKYASSAVWKADAAPHDLGTYPLANGQVYGNGEQSPMPVEESGNMLIMLGALSAKEGNAEYAEKYWPTVSKWANYLKGKGLDPENQLCTDDFAGHLAHNANLSIKAIIGLACYSRMADMLGKKDVALEYRKAAEEMAAKWKTMADDGDHYRLAFDQPGTWSQKYNLVWDRILKLKLFDPSIAETEVAGYKKRLNNYGLPLDNRAQYTKGDWMVWTATLAKSDDDFKILLSPLHRYLDESPDRVPFSDWHSTTDAKVVGFRARSVVGGVYIKMLTDDKVWSKWNKRGSILAPSETYEVGWNTRS